MATIKLYTDLPQSKKLAEILPIESADMYWMHGKLDNMKQLPTPYIIGNAHGEPLWDDFDVPCWSIAVLLNTLPTFTIDSSDDHYFRIHCCGKFTEWHDNLVDACVEMILKLHKLNLL
jgi:hypothetical protein